MGNVNFSDRNNFPMDDWIQDLIVGKCRPIHGPSVMASSYMDHNPLDLGISISGNILSANIWDDFYWINICCHGLWI